MPYKKPYTNWADLPTETTPITASIKDNENNIDVLNSSFNLATVTSGSDYILDISSYYDLASGSKISVDFPTPTVSQNANLSIDNGTTLDLIKDTDGNTLTGNDLDGKQLTLYFDGTDWIVTGTPTSPNLIDGDGTVTDILEKTQAEYDALTPDATTLYIIVG